MLFALLTSAPALCQPPKACPWLNVATASGVLQSSASSPPAALSETNDTACTFRYQDGTASRALKITVERTNNFAQVFIAYKARCGSRATPLRAIGNEAVLCALDEKGRLRQERVIGRVRDAVFTVDLSTSVRNDASMSAETLEEKATMIAEQVAGILF